MHPTRRSSSRGRFLLVIASAALLSGCSKAEQTVSSDSPNVPALPEPKVIAKPRPLVSSQTRHEYAVVMDEIRSHLPFSSGDLDRRPDDTSSSYERRIQTLTRQHRAFSQRWRYYSMDRNVGASATDLSKFIRAQAKAGMPLKMEWECVVFDVRRWKNGGDNVLCSVNDPSGWDYSVIGYFPKGKSLRKGERVKFATLDTAMPVEDDPMKLRFVDLDTSQLRFSPANDAP